MRSISCALGVVACLSAARAEADTSKAWAAAKDNLPANTQFVAVIDVAAIYKSPLYAKALDVMKSIDRDIPKVYDGIKSACGWDPFSVVDGVVIAGDPDGRSAGIAFVQLTIDRAKASTCFENGLNAMLKRMGEKDRITVKQDGIYTVATAGKGKNDTAYFPWVGPNVVAISLKPDHKDKVDAWIGQKAFAKAPVSALAGKLDPKAVVSGAFATTTGKAVDSWVPLIKGYGNWIAAGGKLTGVVTATAPDAKSAQSLADEISKDIQRDLKKDRTPASVKNIMKTIAVTALGTDLTIKGWATEKDLGDAFGEAFMKKKDVSGSSAGSDDQFDKDALKRMDEFSGKMCKCKDKACADKVNDELTKWGTEMAKQAGNRKSQKPDPEVAKKSADIMTRYVECMTKLMMADQPKSK